MVCPRHNHLFVFLYILFPSINGFVSPLFHRLYFDYDISFYFQNQEKQSIKNCIRLKYNFKWSICSNVHFQ